MQRGREPPRPPPGTGVLYTVAYRLLPAAGARAADEADEAGAAAELLVATTRPETILADVAIAVHPQDPRFSRFIGRHVAHPFSAPLGSVVVFFHRY